MKGPMRRWWRIAVALCAGALCAGALPLAALLGGPSQGHGVAGGYRLASAVTSSSCPTQPVNTPKASSPQLVLSGQTTWVHPGGQFVLDLSPSGASGAPPTGLAVYVEVFDQLHNRSDFAETLCNQIPTPLLQTFGPLPVSSLAHDPAHPGGVELPIEVTAPGLARGAPAGGAPAGGTSGKGAAKQPANVLNLAGCSSNCAGVYPVQVVLEPAGGTHVLSELTTHLVLTNPGPGSRRLALAWTLPVTAPPVLSPAAEPTLSSAASASIATLVGAVTAAPQVPITLAPSPITLSALSASKRPADGRSLGRLATWASEPSHQVVQSTYAPVGAAALTGAGLSSELAPQLSAGEAVVASTLHVHPGTGTWLGQGTLDRSALTQLVELPSPVSRLVLSSSELAPLPVQSAPQTTPIQPFALASPTSSATPAHGPNGHRIEAVTSDPGLASHLTDGPGATLAAHQLLADLAMIYFDAPNASYGRGVVLETPTSWQPDPRFLRVALAGLADSPVVQAVTLDQLFAQTPEPVVEPYGGVLVRQLASVAPAPPSLPGRAIRSHRRALSAFASTLGAPPPPVLDTTSNLLLAAESSELSPSQRNGYLDQLSKLVERQFASVKLQTDTVTLTARSAQLPVTITSDVAYPVKGLLQLSSDKLGFGSQGSSRSVTLTQHAKTVEFQVKARATGKFPVQVSLVSPNGDLVLAESRFAVRSSAFSPVGIGLTVAAGLVLVGWWGRSLMRGRRDRNRSLVSTAPASE
ncbi:MAG: DUF6049 family protein [Acidimicrobiales bacterium]